MGQIAPSLQVIGHGESNTVTGRGSPGDPNGERVPGSDSCSATMHSPTR